MKSADKYASEKGTLSFINLIQGFGYEDSNMAMTLLKFINEMLFKSEGDEIKQSKFLAKLEGLGIKDIL